MNLVMLFELQQEADKPYENEPDRLEKDILWLQEELGELLQEWRGHKYRRLDQTPRTFDPTKSMTVDGRDHIKNPLLDEYTDCLSILLSIGVYMGVAPFGLEPKKAQSGIIQQFLAMNKHIAMLHFAWQVAPNNFIDKYTHSLKMLIGLGEMLEFSIPQIEQSFMNKHADKLARQSHGN